MSEGSRPDLWGAPPERAAPTRKGDAKKASRLLFALGIQVSDIQRLKTKYKYYEIKKNYSYRYQYVGIRLYCWVQ